MDGETRQIQEHYGVSAGAFRFNLESKRERILDEGERQEDGSQVSNTGNWVGGGIIKWSRKSKEAGFIGGYWWW